MRWRWQRRGDGDGRGEGAAKGGGSCNAEDDGGGEVSKVGWRRWRPSSTMEKAVRAGDGGGEMSRWRF